MKTDNLSEYRCPKCGFFADKSSLIKRSPAEYNYTKACEFGGNPLDWTEYHECPFCKIKFEFENSNC